MRCDVARVGGSSAVAPNCALQKVREKLQSVNKFVAHSSSPHVSRGMS